MRLGELPERELAARLARGELALKLPPFVVRLKSDIPALARDLACLYEAFELAGQACFADFHAEVSHERSWRHWLKPRARFRFDGRAAFVPLPARQALPMLEWGLNWCVAAHAHHYLIIHAAVVERAGRALLLPAPPGSGKSTLSAALVSRGWRLLSDELALYEPATGLVRGMARPLNLKNRSIDLLRDYAPEAVLSAPVADTGKGTVALMRPPPDSACRAGEPAQPAWIVLPRYVPDAPARLEPHGRAETFMLLAEQSFNYHIHGGAGFDALAGLVQRCQCRRFSYSALDPAVAALDALAAEAA